MEDVFTNEVIILDNEYITLKYLPNKQLIYHVIHQPISGQPLRDALLTGFDALQEFSACKWLSDDRLNGPMSREDAEWGHVNLNQRSMEAGWKYWALIVPQQLIAAGTMLPTMQAMHELGLWMRCFSTVEPAFEWLDSVDTLAADKPA